MGESEMLSSSGERLSFYKLFSEQKLKVEIPIIQRDYAQGRASEHEVRESFLDALYEYLEAGKPHRDLDFVYGSLLGEGDSYRFVPLDGQQRLTTLFLLHWYLAQISGQREALKRFLCKNNRSQFSYETRTSSSEFCDALMRYDLDIQELLESAAGTNNVLSKTIQDKGWFYLSWTHDPTIQSMLTMLDSIHAKFSGCPEFFERLIDEEQPVITFLFLNLHAFSLTDDLYIKMNARGKPLTPFENFKAKFEQRIKSFRADLPSYEFGFGGKKVYGYQYFIHKIDTDWADVFWAYRNSSTKDDTFDDELMSFICLVIANHYLVERSEKLGRQTADIDKFFGYLGRVSRLSFQAYSNLGCLTKDLVEQLITIMDLIHNKGLSDGKLKAHIGDNYYYSEEGIFKKVISNDTTYQEKLLFYAFYTCLAKGLAEDELIEWLRVIYNLTENTIFNTAEDYRSALICIDKLSRKNEPILDILKSGSNNLASAFAVAQVVEERIKAHLVCISDEWKEAVVAAEQHPFFRGQIGFILSFSGILEFYRDHGNREWDMSQIETFFDAFKKYSNAASKLFSLIKDGSGTLNYSWERAVLSKGMYFTKASADRWNLLSTRLAKNNIERDHSWRRLLRIPGSPGDEWENRQGYVKAVFDDSRFDATDVEGSLEKICAEALEDSEIEDWRKTFIKYPALFKECRQGFIVKNADELVLLHESQRNHYHSELWSKVLDLELEHKAEQLLPFEKLPYEAVRSGEESPYVSLGQYVYNGEEYFIEIWYDFDEYHLLFGNESREYPDSVTEILEGLKFNPSDDEYDYPHLTCATQEGVFEILDNLCSSLRGLIDG